MNYTAKEINNIVAEIHYQLTLTASSSVRWSWGAHSYQAIIYKDMPALCFRVSGCLHKGWVMICYNDGTDLYDIYCVSVKHQVKKINEGVYCDCLGQVVDSMVEREIGQTDNEYFRNAMKDSHSKMKKAGASARLN